jgi:hypothetical protein
VQSPIRPEILRESLDNIEHPSNIKIAEATVSDLLLLSAVFGVPDLSARCADFYPSGSLGVTRLRDLENLRSVHWKLKTGVLEFGPGVAKLRAALEAEHNYRRSQEAIHGEHGYDVCVARLYRSHRPTRAILPQIMFMVNICAKTNCANTISRHHIHVSDLLGMFSHNSNSHRLLGTGVISKNS